MSKTGAALARGQSKQDYATPWPFIRAVERKITPIAFDLAASPHNTKHPRYFSIYDDSLEQAWHKIDGLLWLNPEYNNITPWARKCAEESAMGAQIAFLVPASVGSDWFANYVNKVAAVWALRGRIPFDPSNPTWGYPKDCILAHFGGTPGFDVWDWRKYTRTDFDL